MWCSCHEWRMRKTCACSLATADDLLYYTNPTPCQYLSNQQLWFIPPYKSSDTTTHSLSITKNIPSYGNNSPISQYNSVCQPIWQPSPATTPSRCKLMTPLHCFLGHPGCLMAHPLACPLLQRHPTLELSPLCPHPTPQCCPDNHPCMTVGKHE